MTIRKFASAFSKAACMAGGAVALATCSGFGSRASSGGSSKVPGSAQELVREMRIGWNLGNTLDAVQDGVRQQGIKSETCWGQPLATPELFAGLYESGIRTVRIPITWHNHIIDDDYTVDPEWISRVREVAGWALDAGLYAIVNVHHDTAASPNVGYAEGYYPAESARAESMRFLARIWEQAAAAFKDFDGRLAFELLNEPRLRGHDREWWYDGGNADCVEAMRIICEYEQLCLDVIRKSGGNNKARYVLVPGYDASPRGAMNDVFSLPNDSAKGRLILAVHSYDPWAFAGEDPGITDFTEEARKGLASTFSALGERFVRNGIPVIVGECGATNKDNLAEREAWFRFFFGEAWKNGITAIMWDNGAWRLGPDGSCGEHYGYYDRIGKSWYFPSLLQAALDGIADAK